MKINVCAARFFFLYVERGPAGVLEALGAEYHGAWSGAWSGAEIEKNIHFFSIRSLVLCVAGKGPC